MSPFDFTVKFPLKTPPQAHPLPPPPVKIPCSSVPQSALDAAKSFGNPVFCLEDGVESVFTQKDVNPVYVNSHFIYLFFTFSLTRPSKKLTSSFVSSSTYFTTILPIPQGCHTVSYVMNSETPFSDGNLFCLSSEFGKTLGKKNEFLTFSV